MTLVAVDWPADNLFFSIGVTLSNQPFELVFQWVEAPSGGCWSMDVIASDGSPVELGMRLVGGTRFAWRRVRGNEPLGELKLYSPNGLPLPDLPTIEDLQQRRVLVVYDDAAL